MAVAHPDHQFIAHRQQFLAALPRRLDALVQGGVGLRARPESETNRTALTRRLEALREAALVLGLDRIGRALGEAMIAIEGPTLGADDLDLLDEALHSLVELLSEPRPDGPARQLDASARPSPVAASASDDPGEDAAPPGVVSQPLLLAQAAPPSQAEGSKVLPPAPPVSVQPPPVSVQPSSRGAATRGTGHFAAGDTLSGRTVLAADDDAAVLWHVSSALRSAGATVIEARDGLSAWEQCLEAAPELVVCDVMMPRLDGFALCRNLKRDVVLSDVPVILLSWKDDLLQRTRELGAEADGYLRKDSVEEVIVARCAEALAPRALFESRFVDSPLLHGRMDGVTPRHVLELVLRMGGDRVVEFCDAGFAYEAHFSSGCLVGALRRGDHGVQHGESVLRGLLGVRAGRFIVRQTPPLERQFDLGIERLLEPHVQRIRAACRLMRGADLHRVSDLELDQQVIGPYRAASPPVARQLVDALSDGVAPGRLQGSVSAAMLEEVLVDLAIRGAVLSAHDSTGVDLLGESRALPLDAELRTPLPANSRGPLTRGEVSKRSDEREVVFSERLAKRTDWKDAVLAADASPHGTGPSAEKQQRSASIASTSRSSQAPATAPVEVRDLADAVLAELSVTPRAPRARSAGRTRGPSGSPRGEHAGGARPSARSSSRVEKVARGREPPAPTRSSEPATKALARRTLVVALDRVVAGWEGAREHAQKLISRSARLSPPELESELSPPPRPDTRRGAVEPPKQPSPVAEQPRGASSAPQITSEPAPELAVDTDATDPNWLPPVDASGEGPPSVPLVRSLPGARAVARIAIPLALLSAGGYAAFWCVGALGSALPIASSSEPEPGTQGEQAASAVLAQRSAAEQLLEGASSAQPAGRVAEEPDGNSPELDSQIAALPEGITLGKDKGLLEVNSGDKHKIYVAGVFVGRGPARRIPLAPGKHEVRVRLGAEEHSYHVTIESGKRTRLLPVDRTAGR